MHGWLIINNRKKYNRLTIELNKNGKRERGKETLTLGDLGWRRREKPKAIERERDTSFVCVSVPYLKGPFTASLSDNEVCLLDWGDVGSYNW